MTPDRFAKAVAVSGGANITTSGAALLVGVLAPLKAGGKEFVTIKLVPCSSAGLARVALGMVPNLNKTFPHLPPVRLAEVARQYAQAQRDFANRKKRRAT